MAIEIARNVGPARIDIAYERHGNATDPPLLLIMGLGAQLVAWPDAFVDALVARRFHVIRFDNRDVGQSTRFTGIPNYAAALLGDASTATYTLSDMAADTAGLLDALGIASAHIVGASLGGFIAQMLAIEHRARVQTLTSIMSSTGARNVGQPHPETMALFAGAPPMTREQAIERAHKGAQLIGSTALGLDLEGITERAGRAFDRGLDPASFMRQGVAVLASGDRTPSLRTLDVPALVIHGKADKLVDISGGRATAAAIPGAKLVEIEGMGHDLPRAVWPRVIDEIAALAARA
ncbi:MAG: alpha/beta hydrolase [Deltaproteobacteria bacterium]|nr:alpha/beta hydrolase [Deltaproteobacteria bacterium]